MNRIVSRTSMLLGGVCAVALTSQAYAQAPAAPVVEEVVITGSRIIRNGYEAPTPTTVIGAEDIIARGPANIADYVNQLPQLGNATSPRTTRSTSNTIFGSSNLLNMRGLGTARTLVLLDGRRVVSAGLNSAVDINLLPTNLVQRVDIVTGGASAAYGSDAVAGVTNFILDSKFKGIKGSVSYGGTEYGDGETGTADIAIGQAFAGGRGHVILSGLYLTANGIDDVVKRDWYVPGYRLIPNPAYVAGGTQPAQIARTDITFGRATNGGLITAGPLKGTAFGPGGQIYQWRYGDIISGNLQAGGTFEDTASGWPLISDLTNWNTFGRVSYEITDKIRFYGEAGFGKSDSWNWSAVPSRFADITVRNENPFLPQQILNSMAAANITTFQYGRMNRDLTQPGGHVTSIGYHRQQQRWLAALEGDFLQTGKWSAYYQKGTSDVRYNYFDMTIPSYYSLAIDAIRNPATGGVAGVAAGAPICRSTLTNPTNGCVPANIFGEGLISQQSINYITGVTQGFSPAQQDIDINQEVFAFDAQIEPITLPAGPVSVAAGYEQRKDSYKSVVDRASSMGLWFGGGFTPSSGSFTVKEFYGETIIPVLRDIPLVKSLDINGAARRTDYSTSGKVTTWKLGATWEVNDQLRLRGTRSRDIRAPNLLELFNGGVATVAQTRDHTQAGSPAVSTRQITGGNRNLTPEIAKTQTYGVVYRPDWFSGFSVSVDYYKIQVKDAITVINGQAVVDQCFGVGVPQNPAACTSIVRSNPNTLVDATIYIGGINAQQQVVEGVDYELSYRMPIDMGRFNGSLDLRALGSQRLKSETLLAGAITNAKGATTEGPAWRWLFVASYLQGPSRTTATLRYLGEGVLNNYPSGHPLSIAGNHVADVAYLDLAQNYDLELWGKKFTLFGVIENVADTDPPRVPTNSIGAEALYDLLGRSYRAGIRFQF